MNVLELIRRIAEVPSFSSYEERLHPVVLDCVPGVRHEVVPGNNLALWKDGAQPVVLTAHLDKINHLGRNSTEKLPFQQTETELIGQLDDSVGVGLCLRLLERLPGVYVLLSEMEEGWGLKHHPHLLRNNGQGLYHGIGAERLARWLIGRGVVPKIIITLDPTPLFKGASGIAVYSQHWERNGVQPTPELIARTEVAVSALEKINPAIHRRNNSNDYLVYGREFAKWSVPSLAIEPAIFPCHAMPERVFIRDVEAVEELIYRFLSL